MSHDADRTRDTGGSSRDRPTVEYRQSVTRPAATPDHPVVMGVLNVTPDSFSDGGRYADLDAAVAHGVATARRRAPTWSTSAASPPDRAPTGSTRATEIARVLPVIRELAAAGVPMSIDTTRAAVAAAALAAGAAVVNDVSGGLADPDMAARGRRRRLPVGARCTGAGHSRRMHDLAVYDDVVAEVRAELLRAGRRRGRRRRRRRTGSILDPGLGFAKHAEHNWALSRAPRRAGRARLSRCCSGPAASRTSAGCWPARTARRARSDEREAATIATTRARGRRRAPGASGCTTCAATVDALAVWQRRPAARDSRHDDRGYAMSDRDHADRPAGPRPPRRLRLRARATARTSSSTSAGARPRAGRRAATTSPTPCTTASWPAGWSRSSPASRST